MKKLTLFFGITTIFLFGCKKEEQPLPMYTITITTSEGGSVSPDGTITINEGENLTLSMIPNLGFDSDSIVINGYAHELTDNSYKFLKVTEDKNINVTFKKNAGWFLMQGTWKLDSTHSIYWGETISNTDIVWGNSTQTQEVNSFLPNGKTETYWDGEYVGDAPWSIVEGNILNWGGTMFKTLEINNKSLVLFNKVQYLEDPNKTVQRWYYWSQLK